MLGAQVGDLGRESLGAPIETIELGRETAFELAERDVSETVEAGRRRGRREPGLGQSAPAQARVRTVQGGDERTGSRVEQHPRERAAQVETEVLHGIATRREADR